MLYSLGLHVLVIDIGFAIANSVDRKKYIGSMLEKSRFVAYHALRWHVHVGPQQQHWNSQRGKELQSLVSCSQRLCRKCVCVCVIHLSSQQQRHFWLTQAKTCRNLSQRVTFVDVWDIRLAPTGSGKEAALSASSQLRFSFHVWWWSALIFAQRKCKVIKAWLGYNNRGESLPRYHTELYLAPPCTSRTRTKMTA